MVRFLFVMVNCYDFGVCLVLIVRIVLRLAVLEELETGVAFRHFINVELLRLAKVHQSFGKCRH